MANTNGGRINFQVGYNVDQSSVSQVKKSLQDLQNIKIADFKGSEEELQQVKRTASQVEKALTKAFNPNLNSVNIDRFNSILSTTDRTVDTIYADFAKAGSMGRQAFAQMTSSIVSTNAQLTETKTLINSMGQTMANTVKWGIASSIMNTFSNSVQQAFQYVKGLDSALTDIRIVTGDSTQQMAKFADQANRAAQELGRSTMDYTKAALTFYQQGLNDQDVQTRTQAVLKAQNVTGAGQEMADYLTAVWNGYKVANEEAELYVDKLAAVADSSASNMSQLAVAMSKVASVANSLGVPVDSLNAQIATIVATTRNAPESVGNALKTIYSRINDISTGAQDAQISLGNYSSKMLQVGVSVLDANGNLRDTGQVIEQIGGKWESLSREQQIYLARTMAGQRQYNNLIALFDNWNKYTDLVNVSLDSQGSLMQKNSRYMDSLAAHMEQFGAAGERVKAALINEEDIKGIVDFGTSLTSIFGSFIESIGGGTNALMGLGSILTSLFSDTIAKQIGNTIIKSQELKASLQSMSQAQMNTQSMKQSKAYLDENNAAYRQYIDNLTQVHRTWSVLSKDEIETQQNRALSIESLSEQKAEIEDNQRAAKQFMETISGQSQDLENGFTGKAQRKLRQFNNELAIGKEALENYFNDPNVSTSSALLENFELLNGYLNQTPNAGVVDVLTKIRDGSKVTEQQLDYLQDTLRQFYAEASKNVDSSQNIDKLKGKYQQLDEALQKTQNQFDKTNQKANVIFDTKQITNFVAGLGQVASGINGIVNLTKVWKNENNTLGEKLLQTFTNLSFTVPMLYNGLKKVVAIAGVQLISQQAIKQATERRRLEEEKITAEKKKQAAWDAYNSYVSKAGSNYDPKELDKLRTAFQSASAESTKATDALNNFNGSSKSIFQMAGENAKKMGSSISSAFGKAGAALSKTAFSIGGLSVSFAALAGIAAGVVAAGVGIYMWYTKDARAAQKAAKAAQQTNNKYKDLKETLDNFNTAISGYDESIKALGELNKGTEQWNQKLKETNEQVLQLLENYPQLAGAISQNADGLLTIDKQSEEYQNFLDSLNKTTQTANIARLGAQQTSNEAQRTSLITNAARDIGGLDRASLEKLVGAMQTNGNAIIGNSDYLSKELGLTQQQINAIHDNVDKITTLATTIQNNTKATEILGNTISQDLLKDNAAYQNSEYQEEFAEDISNKLANAQFDANKYSTYDSEGVQSLDKNAMAQAYAVATGEQIKTTWYGAFKVFNEQTKQWEKISADVVKNEIAAADAINNLDQYIKDTQQTINKASQTFEDLASAALKFRNVNSEEDLKNVDVKQLSQSDVESLNAQDLVDTFGLEIDPDILADWLEKQATLIEKNTQQFIQTLPLGVQDAFKNLDTSKMSGELQSQMASVLNDAFVKSGGKSLDQLTDFYSRIEQDQLEQVLQIQSSLDFTSLSVEDFRDILEDADIQTNATNGQLRDFINRMAEIQQQAQQLSPEQRYKAIQDITSGLSKGDTISAEDKDTLQSYGIDVESFFRPLADGTWELKGRAQQFARIAKDISLQGLRDQIDLLKNKIDQVNQYTEDDLLQYVGPQQGATVGTEGVSIEEGSKAQQLASQQIDFIELIGAAEEQSIANWRYAIQEKGQISKDQLAQIYTLVEENKDKIGNLSEEEVARLQQLQQQLYNSSRQPLDPDVDEDKYEALSDYLYEYGDQLEGVSEDVEQFQRDADDLAQSLLRYDSALGEVIQHYEDWENVLTNGTVLEQAEAAQQLQNVYSDLLDLPFDNLSPDFTTSIDNLHLLQEAANGSEDAYNQLREAAMQDIAAQVGLDTSQFYTEEGALYDEYNSIQNELNDIEVGAYIDNAQAIQSMNEIINAADMTAQQATDLLASMGVDAQVEQVTVPQNQVQQNVDMVPNITTEPVPIPQILGDGTVATANYDVPTIIYQPIKNTAVAQGSKTTTALKVTSAKKSSGGKFKYNMASNGAGSKGQAARAPKGGGGRKGGGGKGSSPKTTRIEPKAKAEPTQKKEAPHDPYQQNTKALERQEDLIDDLQDAEKKLLDKDRLKNLEKQNEALKEQAKILQDRLVISQQAGQKNTTAWFAKELQSAFGKNIGFDADGRIADRNKAQAAAVAAYNAAVTKADKEYQAARQKYNANAGKQLTDAQKKQIQNQLKAAEDKKKKAIDKAKEQYDEKTKLLDAYEKAWQEDQKTREQIEKAWQQYYENRILQQQIKIDLKIDSGDFERDWLDFEKKVIKKLDKNDFLGQAKANAKQLASYFNSGQIEAVSQRINSIRGQIQKMQEGVTSKIYGNNLAQAQEDLETYMKQQMEDLQKIQDLTEEIQQNYLDAIDKAKDKMDEQIDQYERVNSLIDHNVKLTQLLYGDKAYDTMDKYFQKRRENDQAELDSLRKQQLYWQQKMNQETPGSEAWQRFKKNVDDTTDQLNSKLEDMIQNLSDQWENRVDGIIQKLNNALTGGRGLDYLDEQWDYINNYDDKFLDTVESKMGVQDVERLYNNAIDGLAGNPKAQQRINNLMKDQLKILKEKDHLTEYDLERAKAMLQVEQARMDLEDARNNKTKMRLRRDSQGNYTYQYVADEQKLGDLQDALADAQANLYNMDKQHYKQNLNDLYDTYKDYLSKMKQLTAAYNATQDQEERARIQSRIDLLKDSAQAMMEGLTEDNQVTLYKYLGQSYFDAMGIDPSSFTQEEQFNILRENVPQVQSNIQDLADTIIGEGGILPATAAYMEQIAQATKEYDQAVQSTLTAAGTSTDIIHDVVDDEGKFLDDNINKAKKLVTENNKLIASVDKEITAIQQLLDWLDKYLNKAMNIEQIVRRLRGGFDFYQELKDSDTTAEEIPVTKTPSDTTTGNEYPGSEINPGNSKATQDQLAAILQTSAEYNGMIAENTETTADAISELQHSTISQPEDIPPIDTNATGLDSESISNAAALGAVLANMLNSLAEQDISTLQGLISTSLGHIDNVEELNQNVHIEANFPNVNASAQIEAAFVELVNTAAMYTSRYQKG